jgi:HAE1 family hydrophobic/amphiphilic exporter-1
MAWRQGGDPQGHAGSVGSIVAIALILTAVFVPVAFVPGITGLLYQQFAITIAASVLFSAFNALTLSPALSAMLLKPKQQVGGPLGAFSRRSTGCSIA